MKWLDFWLACRTLGALDESKDGAGVRAQLGKMSKDFFGGGGGGVSLSNAEVRRKCAEVCSKQKGGDLGPLWIAQGRRPQFCEWLRADVAGGRAA